MKAFVLVALVGCGKPDDKQLPIVVAKPAPVVVAKPKQLTACDLTSADAVGKIFNKNVVASDNGAICSFTLSPAEIKDNIAAFASGQTKILEQVQVAVAVVRDDETEDAIKSANARVGSAVMTALTPAGVKVNAKHVVTEVPGLGEWAFMTDGSLTMNGIAVGGRVFDARVGAWRVTIEATVSPDPGAKKLDAELMDLARPAVAKLKS
jgi:hypothetical protein